MKFGKTAQLILAIGIFTIGIVFLYRMNQERAVEYEELNTQLATAQALLPEIVSEGEELQIRLSQLQTDLDQAEYSLRRGKAKFTVTIDSIEYDWQLYQMARDRDLEMMTLFTSEPREMEVGNVTLTIYSFDMEVKGTVADILNFANVMATDDDFTTATVEIVSISVPEPLTLQEKEGIVEQAQQEEDGEGEEELGAPSAFIQLEIYSYEGD